jgi:UDP-N-acetylmuramyl pentapeptide phosphotransferase/UDP-N-acetylglucosamine-1-phosphate transferase
MSILILIAAFLLCHALIVALKPLLARYALARPNARSSHSLPTPQGGGVAVIGACLIVLISALMWSGAPLLPLTPFLISVIALAILGFIDDIRPLSAGLRLGLQGLAVMMTVLTLHPPMRLFEGFVPAPLEMGLVLFIGLWFVNLTNFMDGLDWITLADLIPLTAFCAVTLHHPAFSLLALALLGALLGFAPFNKPVAKLFLGDVGALPLGLISGVLLLVLAHETHVLTALILPLYPLMDASLTLLMRLRRGENITEAHRSHFYQRATINGFSVRGVVGPVFILNLLLAGLAGLSVAWPSFVVRVLLLLIGVMLTAALLFYFNHKRAHA